MNTLQIIQLARLAVSAAVSIGLDIERIREMMDEEGNISDENLQMLLAEAQAAVDQL